MGKKFVKRKPYAHKRRYVRRRRGIRSQVSKCVSTGIRSFTRSAMLNQLHNVNTAYSTGGNISNGPVFSMQLVGGATATYIGVGIGYQLNDLSNFTEFQSLFDQYRIIGIKTTIYPLVNSTTYGNGQVCGMIHWIQDHDDSSAPATTQAQVQAMMERGSYRHYPVIATQYNGYSRFLKPHVAIASYAGAFSGYSNNLSPWADTDSYNIQHYGDKILFELWNQTSNDTSLSVKIIHKFYLQFKDVQ